MKRKLLTVVLLILLSSFTLVMTVNASRAQRTGFEVPRSPDSNLVTPLTNPPNLEQSTPTDCALQPELRTSLSTQVKRASKAAFSEPITLLRFRGIQFTKLADPTISPNGQRPTPNYMPREEIVLIDPTNYGDRFLKDINGEPANLNPLIVLHETVGSASSTLNFFRTPHSRETDQASYHTLIKRDGTIVYLVPPDKRAFGAGNSVFNGRNGPEAVKTHRKFSSSVNNFAYHISLETPPDGINNAPRHSGYTNFQYQSLAWLVAKTSVPDDRITTHKAIDRSNSRMDPRSFSFSTFFKLLQTHTKTNDIAIQCTIPPGALQTKQPNSSKKTSHQPKKPLSQASHP